MADSAALPTRFVAGADAMAEVEANLKIIQAQVAAHRDLSASLLFEDGKYAQVERQIFCPSPPDLPDRNRPRPPMVSRITMIDFLSAEGYPQQCSAVRHYDRFGRRRSRWSLGWTPP
jgi:hypothetical protein